MSCTEYASLKFPNHIDLEYLKGKLDYNDNIINVNIQQTTQEICILILSLLSLWLIWRKSDYLYAIDTLLQNKICLLYKKDCYFGCFVGSDKIL